MKELQKDLRTLWTIISLLDGQRKNQNQITKFLNNIDILIKKLDVNKFQGLIKTNNSLQSPIIIELSEKEIIERELVDVEGKNLKANICSIPVNVNSLSNIIVLIDNSQIRENRKKFFLNQVIVSEFGKELIDYKIIPKLLEINNISSIPFTSAEKKFINHALRNSPQALRYTILSINNRRSDWKQHTNDRNFFLYKLQALLNLDLIEQYSHLHEIQDSGKKIEFNTEITILHDFKSKDILKTDISEANMKFNLLLDYVDDTSTPEQTLNEYIQTYS